MKQFFTLLSATLLCSASAVAQLSQQPVTTLRGVHYNFMPADYVKDGATVLYSEMHASTETEGYQIFDQNFTCTKSFEATLEQTTLQTKTYTNLKDVWVRYARQHRRVEQDCPTGSDQQVLTPMEGGMTPMDTVCTYEQALSWLKYMYSSITPSVQSGNGYHFYINSGEYNYEYDKYGTTYPLRYFKWSPEPGATEAMLYECYAGGYSWNYVSSEDVVDEYCRNRGYEPVTVNGEKWYYPKGSYNFFFYERFGTKYPESCYKLESNGVLFKYSTEYTVSAQLTDGWILEPNSVDGEVTVGDRLGDMTLVSAKFGGLDDYEFSLSQTLFNNDDLYEYVVRTYRVEEREEFSDSYIAGIGYYNIKRVVPKELFTGLKVVNENGVELAKITLPTALDMEYRDADFDLVDFGSVRYLVISLYGGYEEGYSYVYKIDPTSSGVMELVGDPIKIGISPRIARRSTPIQVSFGGEGKGPRQVVVTSVNGQTVMTRNVEAGVTEMSIDTSRMGQGMYVVSVVENGKRVENCKVIIR